MLTLNQVETLFVKSNCSFEYTSYLNSYSRCLPDWTHYQSRHAASALGLGSFNFNSAQGGQRRHQPGNYDLSTIGNLFARSRDWGFRHIWKRCAGAVENFISRPSEHAQLAEESAQSCLAGLSRFDVTGESRLELKPHTDRVMVKMVELKPQPLLVSAGSMA